MNRKTSLRTAAAIVSVAGAYCLRAPMPRLTPAAYVGTSC